MSQNVVLLSAGLDSSVNFLEALQDGGVRLAITFDYGQRAALREIQKAKHLCQRHQVAHQVVELPFFKLFTQSSLVNHTQSVPQGSDVDIASHSTSLKTAEKVWVPNRNGIFLNVAAGFAEGLGVPFVIPGFNAEEASTFPDNSPAFQKALDGSFSFSTQNQVTVKCYTLHKQKAEILRRGLEIGLEIQDIWPCYFGEEKWCGQCESCLRFENARREVKV